MRIQSMATLAVAVIVSGVGPAAAQQSDKAAAAEQLFTQGRDLMARGDLEAACPKFAASFELDPALGTLFNLAHCYEKQNRLASAWAHYRQAADLARRAGQKKRETFARERVDALQPRVPRLVIHAPEGVSGMTIARDGVTVDRALWGVAVYVDPGEHQVTATAPGHQPFTTTVVAVESEEAAVDIPELEPEEPVEPAPDLTVPAEPEPEAPEPIAEPAEPAQPGKTRRIIAVAAGSAGIAALAAGLGLGLSAKSTWDEAFSSDLCDSDSLQCSPEGQEQTDSARTRATASNILTGAGVVLVGAGAVLYLTAPKSAEGRARAGDTARVVPTAGPDGFGLAVMGGF